jgi:hypothetical protein
VQLSERQLKYIAYCRYKGEHMTDIAKRLGIERVERLKEAFSQAGGSSPLAERREIIARDKRRSNGSDLAEYFDQKRTEILLELEKELEWSGNCPPYAPNEPYLFNVSEYEKKPEFVPTSTQAINLARWRMERSTNSRAL